MPDINTWIKQLSAKPLPVLAPTHKQLLQLMKNENLSIGVYAGPALLDPGMAVIFLQDVNKVKVSQGRDPIGTLSGALPHLGPAKIKQHVNKAILLDDLKLSARHYDGYMRYLTQACHASFQARDWGMQRHTIEPEEIELAALLQNITELALWCYGDDVMLQIEHRVYVEKQDYDKAAKEVLGCSLRQLSVQLAQSWHLPELVVLGLGSDYKGFTLATGAALAARLARLSAYSWYDRKALRCVQAIADYQGHSIAEVEHHLHLNAVNFSDYHPHLNAWTAAKLLPMLVDEKYIDRSFEWGDEPEQAKNVNETQAKIQTEDDAVVTKPASVSTKNDSTIDNNNVKDIPATASTHPATAKVAPKEVKEKLSPSTKASNKPSATTSVVEDKKKPVEETQKTQSNTGFDAAEMARQVSLLQAMIKKKDSVAHIIQQATQATHTLGFERVMFAIKVPKKEELMAKFFSQNSTLHELKSFKIVLDKPHLFKLLMAKPQNIWLNEKNKAKYWGLIPANVKLALHNDNFFAMSVFVNKKPVGLMYADKPTGQLNAAEYKKFQGLCKMLSKGLSDIVQKPAAKKEG